MITYERIDSAYNDCMAKKSTKPSALQFSFVDICKNLLFIVHDINNRTYIHGSSSCFIVNFPTVREIFAAQFRDRVIQHFFMQEIMPCLDDVLIENTASCRLNKGTDFALYKLRQFVTEETNYGREDAYFIKIDLSGYFMSLDRDYITNEMITLINERYNGKYKDELIYLAPIIFKNDPTKNCIFRTNPENWFYVPDRKSIFKSNGKGLAIGNTTSQSGSNLNLNKFDHYCIEDLDLPDYIRYVDDIIIVNKNKNKLYDALPLIENKLESTGQKINRKKTYIDTVYHGVKFLGHITYPYGYQTAAKNNAGRLMNRATSMIIDDHLLSRLNSQIGRTRHFATFHLMQDFIKTLPKEVWEYVYFDKEKLIFKETENYGRLRNKNSLSGSQLFRAC